MLNFELLFLHRFSPKNHEIVLLLVLVVLVVQVVVIVDDAADAILATAIILLVIIINFDGHSWLESPICARHSSVGEVLPPVALLFCHKKLTGKIWKRKSSPPRICYFQKYFYKCSSIAILCKHTTF